MTDKIHSLTVVLDHNIRSDDVRPIIEAIKMVRCVQEVVPQVADVAAYMAESRAKQLWEEMLYDFLRVARDSNARIELQDFLKKMVRDKS